MRGKLFGYARVSVASRLRRQQLRDPAPPPGRLRQVFYGVGSGASWNRSGLRRLKAALQPGDCVNVGALDRLGRSVAEVLDLLGWLRDNQVEVISLRGSIDQDSAMGRAMLHRVISPLALTIPLLDGARKDWPTPSDRSWTGSMPGAPPDGTPCRTLIKKPPETLAVCALSAGRLPILDSTPHTAISRGRPCGRGPVCRKLRRKVPRVDGALTTQPRTPTVPPARSASVSSMQSPPASAEATMRQHLVPRVGPLRRAAEVEVMADKFPQAQVLGEGVRQEQAGIGHQAVVVKGDADTVGIVLWQHLLGAPCFRADFCSKTIIPDSEEHPPASSRAVPKALPRWIRAKESADVATDAWDRGDAKATDRGTSGLPSCAALCFAARNAL